MPTDLDDDTGNLAASNSSDGVNNATGIGFGPPWRRFLLSGTYNGDFAAPTPKPDQTLDNVNNALPYWSVSASPANSCSAQWVANSSASGGAIRMTIDGLSSGATDMYKIEQLVPIESTNGYPIHYAATLSYAVIAATGAFPRITIDIS